MNSFVKTAGGGERISGAIALYSILGFWLFYVAVVTVRAAIMDFPNQYELAERRAFVTAIGIALTWGMYLLLRQFDNRRLWVRIVSAFALAVPCAIAIAGINYYVFNIYDPSSLFTDGKDPRELEQVTPLMEIAEVAISRYFFLCAWAALYLAMSYASAVRAAERKLAQFERAAQAAELKSLRYQVNPHFLFNTLNSLSALVMKNRPADAEAMIMNLSTFYRTSLSGDPLEDVTLAEEVRLQQLYLDIEKVRFPDRLRTEIDVPVGVAGACVPGLILQPLIENAIKYGVSRANRPVTISISARAEGELLVVEISDDGIGVTEPHDHGGGIGLANVRDRLAARFGEKAAMMSGPRPGGGFAVTLTMPITRGPC